MDNICILYTQLPVVGCGYKVCRMILLQIFQCTYSLERGHMYSSALERVIRTVVP